LKSILFLAAHRPGRSPGQRFRFEQYLSYLQEKGFRCEVSFLLNAADDAIFYKKGHYFRKLLIFLKTLRIRRQDVRRASNYDLVFLYREAVMFGSVWFEKRLAKKCPHLILDYDDAIWLKDVSEGNRRLSWLKRPSKTEDIIKLCHLVITGNEYLAAYARRFSSNVVVVPTTIETDKFVRSRPSVVSSPVCIGWTGSITTLRHLELALPVLQQLYARYGDGICFRVIADRAWDYPGLPVQFIRWQRETEIEDLSAIHIGIMPLPDDDWAHGKCGFKGLQYMALGIPAVMSPVGVNREIIRDGENGFLAATNEEWIARLTQLIEDPSLRERLGAAGRKTVEDKYSFNAWKDRYVGLLESV
jgi:glycosyltransferase involved in cell wall biosynthesis